MIPSRRDYNVGQKYLGRYFMASSYFPITYLGNFRWQDEEGREINHACLSEVRSKEPVNEVRPARY